MTPTRLVLFSLAALGLAACVDNGADAPMLILRNLAPQDGCVLNADTTDSINAGRIQVGTPVGYLFTPLIRNDLTVVTGEATGPKTIFLEGARVQISFYDPAFFDAGRIVDLNAQDLLKFVAPVSGSIEPGGGTAAIAFEIVPHELIAYIADQITAAGASTLLDVHVQMFGTRGGSTIESNVFRFPVQVCHDCLVGSLGLCSALSSGVSPRTGGACNSYQDLPLDCCDQGTATLPGPLLCPAQATGGT